MKEKIKIIITIIITITLMAVYINHKNKQREEYAIRNNCEWVIYSGYELCK